MDITILDLIPEAECESTCKKTECVRISSKQEQIDDAVLSWSALQQLVRFRARQQAKNGNGKKPAPLERQQSG